MTNKKTTLAIALLALALGACSKEEAPAHEGAEAADAAHSSSAGLPEGHPEAGKLLASTKNAETGQACVDCHGAEGNAPIDPTYPKLGGQYADYIGHALVAYRKGDRQHALMSAQAKSLTDQQIADLGAYFQTIEPHIADLQHVDDAK
ncbi:cytochrome c [Lysobacter sp. KIS68-7]|uniref:c-type cytochrome n=1 Tax=Lysobacter sp. KIS68-7 TaxID=2904252 RepID=UPI001E39696F|nr:cytochrome c [Lysobacter sp. KIS68-7]UHQ18895.1 cytochrome c [Lysobacter sp. KIS68-7]